MPAVSDFSPRPLSELVAEGWAEALAPAEVTIRKLGEFLRAEQSAGRSFLPTGSQVLRAFQTPLSKVRVLVVGQDPYPTPGHPIGLSFAVSRDVSPIPRSLQNIYAELNNDLGIPAANHGDLSSWQNQGVMLLNRVLTVSAGQPGSHRGKGWEEVTEFAIRALVSRTDSQGAPLPLVAILWGRDARTVEPLLATAPAFSHMGGVPVVASAHPSPLSARRGFFGSRPFSAVNSLLEKQGAEAIDWQVY